MWKSCENVGSRVFKECFGEKIKEKNVTNTDYKCLIRCRHSNGGRQLLENDFIME